jgi:hypothetical protein
MAIAPFILLHSSPRSRLRLAFQSVVPGLVEAASFFPVTCDRGSLYCCLWSITTPNSPSLIHPNIEGHSGSQFAQ